MLVLLLVGFLGYLIISSLPLLNHRKESVEYLASKDSTDQKEVMVDVSGAVVSPGVYKLSGGSRIKDALVAAGGISLEADREYLATEVNQAARLTDGMKIYIPVVKQMKVAEVVSGGTALGAKQERININTASASELDGLYGVGLSRAEQIIANRPYLKVDDLLEKKVITKSVLDKIRDKVAVY